MHIFYARGFYRLIVIVAVRNALSMNQVYLLLLPSTGQEDTHEEKRFLSLRAITSVSLFSLIFFCSFHTSSAGLPGAFAISQATVAHRE